MINRRAYIDSGVIDRLAGVLAIQAGWNTAPTNLAYANDGNLATATGLGINTAVATGTPGAGYIQFAMGAVYRVQMRARMTLKSTVAGGCNLTIQTSDDGVTWFPTENWNQIIWSPYLAANTPNTGHVSCIFTGWYFRFYMVNNTGAPADIGFGITEIQAVDMGI